MMIKKIWLGIIGTFAIPAGAELIIDNQLNFGEITVRNNSNISTVTVYRSGSTQSTNHIYILKPGGPAVLTLLNMPPFTNIKLTAALPATSASAYPNSAQFTITSLDMPSDINTGNTGTVQFKIGGTLSTSGDGNHNYYSGAVYQILLDVNLDY